VEAVVAVEVLVVVVLTHASNVAGQLLLPRSKFLQTLSAFLQGPAPLSHSLQSSEGSTLYVRVNVDVDVELDVDVEVVVILMQASKFVGHRQLPSAKSLQIFLFGPPRQGPSPNKQSSSLQ
jgi:hypothetical protein